MGNVPKLMGFVWCAWPGLSGEALACGLDVHLQQRSRSWGDQDSLGDFVWGGVSRNSWAAARGSPNNCGP